MNLFILHWSNKIEKVDIIATFPKKGWREENFFFFKKKDGDFEISLGFLKSEAYKKLSEWCI